MVSTRVKLSHRDWIRITPRKAAKMYQVANWCLRSSGSLGGFFAFGSAAVSRLSPNLRNCRKRQPGAGSVSLVGLSSMSGSCSGAQLDNFVGESLFLCAQQDCSHLLDHRW